MLKLIGTDGSQYYAWSLQPGNYSVGRSSECEFAVPDRTISRKHCRIEVAADGSCRLEDLQSHNGTFVNGVKVASPVPLSSGDHVRFGQVEFKCLSDDQSSGMQRAQLTDQIYEKSVYLSMNEILKPLPAHVSDLPELLPTLFDMAKILVLPEPQHVMLERSLAMVAKVIPAERFAVLFTSEDREEIYTAAVLLPGGKDPGQFTLSKTIVRELLTNKNAILIGDPNLDPRFAGQQSIIMSSLKSAMAAPLLDEDRVLGILYVDTTSPAHQYSDEYLRLFATFGNIIASRLVNFALLQERTEKQAMETELRRASSIQKNLLIKIPPTLPGYSIAAFQKPSRSVGGDLYDLALLPDGRLVFMVADVSGKGMGAALLMSNILASFRILYSSPDFDLERAVKQVSTQLLKYSAPEDFATLFVGVASANDDTVTYLNAGHNPPLVARRSGEKEFLPASGTMIGAFDFSSWTVGNARLAEGDLLMIFSDGVTEAERGEEQYSDARMEDLVVANRTETPEVVAQRLMDDIETFVGDAPRSDDITMLILKRDKSC
jgi:phosphoserine phosphatase RsbU/P